MQSTAAQIDTTSKRVLRLTQFIRYFWHPIVHRKAPLYPVWPAAFLWNSSIFHRVSDSSCSVCRVHLRGNAAKFGLDLHGNVNKIRRSWSAEYFQLFAKTLSTSGIHLHCIHRDYTCSTLERTLRPTTPMQVLSHATIDLDPSIERRSSLSAVGCCRFLYAYGEN